MLVQRIASALSLPPSYVHSVARSASHHYKRYEIPKRAGGTRVIYQPSKQLKAIQRWLLRNIILKLPVHDAATAYRAGSTIWANAGRHADSRFLLRMDFENFFPNLTGDDLRKYTSKMKTYFAGWSPDDIEVLVSTVALEERLTIGAPTSPSLSNALSYFLDDALASLAIQNGVVYSRYADDLFFSAKQPDVLGTFPSEVERICRTLDIPSGLHINAAKTRHSSKRGARRVTGISLGTDGQPHVPRHYKREIRALIHRLGALRPAQRIHLAGLIAFVIGFEPEVLNALIIKYGHTRVMSALHP